MPIAQERLIFDTKPCEVREITRELDEWTARQGIASGLLTVFIRHSSALLLIQENYSPDVRRDLEEFLDRLAPRADPDLDRRVARQLARGRRPECFDRSLRVRYPEADSPRDPPRRHAGRDDRHASAAKFFG